MKTTARTQIRKAIGKKATDFSFAKRYILSVYGEKHYDLLTIEYEPFGKGQGSWQNIFFHDKIKYIKAALTKAGIKYFISHTGKRKYELYIPIDRYWQTVNNREIMDEVLTDIPNIPVNLFNLRTGKVEMTEYDRDNKKRFYRIADRY